MQATVDAGSSHPLGAQLRADGVNFSLYSRSATQVELLLFDAVDDAEPASVITLTAPRHRSYHYWHAFVHGIGAGQLYGYRVHGPWDPAQGHRFDAKALLLDPYARAICQPADYHRDQSHHPQRGWRDALKCAVTDPNDYDWEGDRPLRRSYRETVIYELHVRGFTRHPSSGVAAERAGSYAGLIERIPYLQQLGITAVELLPVFQFDALDAAPGHRNYWGYAPLSFFAPHAGYSSRRDALGPLDEFRDMVKALHRAGIEVILDVVFNHSAEGDERGPTLSLRGLENRVYYHLQHDDRSRYANYSGTGNTLNANHAVVRRMIRDSLRFWVGEMHVDGFRFDLAAVLSRDENGHPQPMPPLIWDIETDPLLAGTKLIAEAWDAAGLYQVGSFAGDTWQEWNGRFRDDVRRFVRGDRSSVGALASRLLGSPDLYAHEEREPEQSVNFVTCHDGFTLNDLVSYNHKHNLANGEANRDGSDANWSWNCGVEGDTDDPQVLALRARQVRNLLTLLLIGLGTPMLSMGDEVRRSQRGNNNAWCQDNDISWFDWQLLQRHADLLRFVRKLIALRQLRIGRQPQAAGMSLRAWLAQARQQWGGVQLGQPDWSEDSHSLAVTLAPAVAGGPQLHAMFNAWRQALRFELPPGQQPWRRLIDTAKASPEDISAPADAAELHTDHYWVNAHSIVLLLRPPDD